MKFDQAPRCFIGYSRRNGGGRRLDVSDFCHPAITFLSLGGQEHGGHRTLGAPNKSHRRTRGPLAKTEQPTESLNRFGDA